MVEDLSSKLRRKERLSKMWMGICYLFFYEDVSAAVCEGAVVRQFGRKTVFQRCGWLAV